MNHSPEAIAKRRRKLGLNHYVRCAAPKCMTSSVIYAAGEIPLCLEHAEAARSHLSAALARLPKRRVGVARPDAPKREPSTRPSVVYYGLVQPGFVKIGHTTNPMIRWENIRKQYPDLTILVVEPGRATEETARHARFVDLRVRQTELFHYGDALQEHTAELRDRIPGWRDLCHEAHAAYKAACAASKRSPLLVIP